jgi:hypothetical protein
MKKLFLKSFLPHFGVLVVFFVITLVYFSPIIEGKVLTPGDVRNFEGMSKEIKDFRENIGEEALWTNSMFGGMPAYLISTIHPGNKLGIFHKILNLGFFRPVSFLFLSMLCFYILLLVFRVRPPLAIIGSIAYAFSSYSLIIIIAGHVTKSIAIAYLPAVIAGIYLMFRKNKLLLGGAIYTFFFALQLKTNHYQIVYYMFLIIIIFGIVKLFEFIKEKNLVKFILISFSIFGFTLLALLTTSSNLWTTYEYSKYSIRGKSELTSEQHNRTSGLDKDYATQWSYGIDETLTILIPNFKGGGSGEALGENSASYKFFEKLQGSQYAKQVTKRLPMYWGSMPFTEGPVYFGAIVMLFFVLGIFILDKKLKWWLISATILSVMLAWGHNFMLLTDFFLDYVPGYNKFRTVSMILVIAQFTIPLMAILALNKVFDGSFDKQKLEKAFKNSFYIVGGIALFFALFPGMFFDFSAQSDQGYIAQGGQAFVDALRADRKMMLRNDAFRSLVFILLSAGVVYAFIKNELKLNYVLGLLFVLVLVDMWAVDKRYLNDDNFVSKRQAKEPFQMTQADKHIFQDKDPNFRVLNLTVNTFNNSSTSYFHKSIGGYHGAKMRRYSELIDHQISKNNMDVLNMLNTKYFIVPDNNKQPVAQYNADALGNAWFVENYRIVPNADAEIEALSDFNPTNEAIVDERFEQFVSGKDFSTDTSSYIKLDDYKPNHLTYSANCNNEKLAVFSEIYYPKGWNAYIDGELTDHFRVNYVLRAMVIPEGEHVVEFKFEPRSYDIGNKISMVSSLVLIIFLIFAFGNEILVYYKKNKE